MDRHLLFTSVNRAIGTAFIGSVVLCLQACGGGGGSVPSVPPYASQHVQGSGTGDPSVIAEYPLPTTNGEPIGITSGSDGNLWFTERRAGKIGSITTTGSVTEFALPGANPEPQF